MQIRLVSLITLFILLSCTSQNTTEKIIVSPGKVSNDTISNISSKDTTLKASTTIDFPRLTQENHERILKKYLQENSERTIRITTDFGTIDIRLFDETPIHTANFLMLVKRGYFNNTFITRVVPQFVVQGGTTDLEETEMKRLAIGSYELKPEFSPKIIHKKGVIAAARNYVDNPNKLSAPYNFFIVVGRTFKHSELVMIARNHDMEIPQWAQDVYQNIGGAPHLDGQHTVFGEVVSGMDVVEKINRVETDEREWPLEEVIINMEALK